MDLCPPEILLNIFALACVDGGRTGCSLSLVSHRIYVASFPARYHTVALWGFPRMCIFQKTLAAMSSHPPAVHHLFIYDGHDVPITGTDVLEVATSIISALSQSLVTLAGSLSPNLHGVEYNSVIAHLPLLQDLGLCFMGLYSISSDLHLPKLRRLHKWDRLNKLKDLSDINVIIRVAPQLTELRLSNIAKGCLRELQAMLKGEPDALGGMDRIELPQTLRHLFVQGSRGWGWGHIETIGQEALERLLDEVAGEHKKVIYVKERGYNIEKCKKDWLEGIEGGDGCWRVYPRTNTSTVS